MFCKTLALLGMLMLGGCAGQDTSTDQPSFYASMASTTAKLDAEGAASMISEYRRNNGLGSVTIDPQLMKMAETQSQAMASRNKLDHNVAGPFAKRLKDSGLDSSKGVENISAGYHTMAEAFSGWRDSPPHRANMLATDVTKMGIASVYAPNSKYKVFWTMVLAEPAAR
jgi:uncharacterized protein YkwD